MIIDKKNTARTAVNRGELKHKVFIVDDHPVLCEGLTYLINHETDLTVCGTAGDMSAALKAIDICQPDIAIVDITLGDISGIRLVEELALRRKDLPTLVLSVHDESLYAERSLKAGARGYIMKTEPSEKILSALRIILNGDIYVSEYVRKSFFNKLVSHQEGMYGSSVDRLSNREFEVFRLISQGLRTQQIANTLHLSVKTIETYKDHIKKKMNLKSSHDVLIYATRWAITDTSSSPLKTGDNN